MGPGVKKPRLAASGCNGAATCHGRLAPQAMPQRAATAAAGCNQGGYRMGPPLGDAGLKPILLKMKISEMVMPTQKCAVKQIGLMLAGITNESNLALTFQFFGILIVMTGPCIVLRFGGRNWIGRLRILRGILQWSTRHGETSG